MGIDIRSESDSLENTLEDLDLSNSKNKMDTKIKFCMNMRTLMVYGYLAKVILIEELSLF